MASIGGVLAIPEQVIVGSGSYVIPEDRYGFLSMSTSVGARADNGDTNNNGSGAGASGGSSANSNHQWVTAGDILNTSNSYPSASYTGSFGTPSRIHAHSRVQINTVNVCVSYASASGGKMASATTGYSNASSSGFASWSLSLFRIPKANLPVGAAEGE